MGHVLNRDCCDYLTLPLMGHVLTRDCSDYLTLPLMGHVLTRDCCAYLTLPLISTRSHVITYQDDGSHDGHAQKDHAQDEAHRLHHLGALLRLLASSLCLAL